MKIRTDFVTNSSSSSFSVLITLTGTNGQNTQLYEDSSEYSEDFSSLAFIGTPKKIALGFDSVEELCRYLSDSIENDFESHYYNDNDENETPDFFQDRSDAFIQKSLQTFHSISDIARIEIEYDASATGEGNEFVADADLYKMTIDMKEKKCSVLHRRFKDEYGECDDFDDESDEADDEREETISWDKNDKWTEEDENNELQNNDYYDEEEYICDDSLDDYDEDEEVGIYHFNDIPVVGTQYENRNERIEKVCVGDRVELVREPDNQYDFNAILVRNSDGSLGYISAEDNSFIAPLLDSGNFTYEAEVTTVIPLSMRSEKCKASILKISFQLIKK